MLVGNCPGFDDVRGLAPFLGYPGQELTRMLAEIGIVLAECFATNVLRFMPPSNPNPKKDDSEYYMTTLKGVGKEKGWEPYHNWFLSPVAKEHIEDLYREIEAVQPNVIIALGNVALGALTGETGITKWRGSIMGDLRHNIKVIPAFHPGAIQSYWAYRKITVQDLRRAKEESEDPTLYEVPYDFIIQPTFKIAMAWLDRCIYLTGQQSVHISCDIETRGYQIACIGFAISAVDAICIPLMSIAHPEGYWSEEEEFELTQLIIRLLSHPNLKLSGQNFFFDATYLAKQWGVLPHLWHDTMNMQHVLFPDMPATLKPKSLGFLATMWCKHPRFWKDEGKLWDPKVHSEAQLWEYNCKDCVATWEIAEAQQKAIVALDLTKPAQIQMDLWRPLIKMSLRGVLQDMGSRKSLSRELAGKQKEIEKRLEFLLDHPFNPSGSSPQGKNLFYTDLNLKAIKKDGRLSLDKEALELLAIREPIIEPITKDILDWRGYSTFHNTFVNAPVDPDHRMRCSWNLATAKTFRLSSSSSPFNTGANLQNQPGEARILFLADPDYIIFDVDLDRADLQVVIWEADDIEMKQMMREGVNIHKENAKIVGLNYKESKMWVHATDYGAAPRTLAAKLSKTVHEMEQAQARWFSAHPGIPDWQKRVKGNLPRAENKFGYRIDYFDRPDSILPKALAWIPQSTVANVINIGLLRVDAQIPEVQLLMQVHDSLVFQIHKDQVDSILPKVMDLLRVEIPYSDPLIIPVSAKQSSVSWGDVE